MDSVIFYITLSCMSIGNSYPELDLKDDKL